MHGLRAGEEIKGDTLTSESGRNAQCLLLRSLPSSVCHLTLTRSQTRLDPSISWPAPFFVRPL